MRSRTTFRLPALAAALALLAHAATSDSRLTAAAPVLGFSTYFTASGDLQVTAAAVDSQGAVYLTGSVWAPDLPVRQAFQPTLGGSTDAFVAKFDSNGALVYCTYLGGSNYDAGLAIAVDSTGAAYVTGQTFSGDIRPVGSPAQWHNAGNADAFVAKLSPAGDQLVYFTYLGGSDYEAARAIAIDSSGRAYVAGETISTNFPLLSAVQGTLRGAQNAFVAGIGTAGQLVFSTYLGGSGTDSAYGIAVDPAGGIYITGATSSLNFPATSGAFQTASGGYQDAFVTKLSAGGASLAYSTYLGGSGGGVTGYPEMGTAIDVDASGSAYVGGITSSANFPVRNAIAPTISGTPLIAQDGFVTRLAADGGSLIFSTYLGGRNIDHVTALRLDSAGPCVAGTTYSSDFPLYRAQQAAVAGSYDAFLTCYSADGAAYASSTVLGGKLSDGATALALSSGRAWVAGTTSSIDFPLVNPYQSSSNSSYIASFLARLDGYREPLAASPTLTAPPNGATGIAITPTLTWTAASGATGYNVYLGTAAAPPLVGTTTTATSYAPAALTGNTKYYWQVAATNSGGAAPSQTWTFTTACTYQLSGYAGIASGAATGSLTLTTQTGCAWTVSSDSAWLTITSSASGSGPATITYSATANPANTARSSGVTAGGQSGTLTQAAAPCTYTLAASSIALAAAAGTGTLALTTPIGCTWTAASNQSWLTITAPATGSSSGPLAVAYSFTANAGSAQRTATLTIGGQTAQVTQAPGSCVFTIAPTSLSLSAAAASGSLTLSGSAGCAWTASSDSAWLTITSAQSGSGGATVSYAAIANPAGTSRVAVLTIGGQSVTVTQAGVSCTYSLDKTTLSLTTSAATGTVTLTAPAGCAWTASSDSAWLTVTSAASGTGGATISYAATANAGGAQRSGTLSAGGATLTVTQAGVACTYSLTVTTTSLAAGAGNGSGTLTTPSGCAWTASSNASWLTVTSATPGTGSATVTYAFTANPANSTRTAALSVGGQNVSLTQAAAPCTYTLSPTSLTIASGGGTGSLALTTPAGCTWTASSDQSWFSITSSQSGTGAATLNYSATANTLGISRTANLAVGAATLVVTESGVGCTASLSTAALPVAAGGGSGLITLTVASGCAWTASSDQSWITVTASGTGGGSVSYTATANSNGPARTATLTIAGQTATVTQAGLGCTASLSASSLTLAAGAASGSITLTLAPGCAWTASSDQNWITVTASGTGGASVSYTASANPNGLARTANLTIAGQTVTVSQAGLGCTASLTPANASQTVAAGTGSLSLAVALGCTWTAASDSAWLTITSAASGSGPATVTYSVTANPLGISRAATVTVAGQGSVVTQAGTGCAASLSASVLSLSNGSASGSITLTVAAGCTWTASSDQSWLTVTASGTGSASVAYAATANPNGPARTATLTIAGQTVAVTQAGLGCTVSLSTASLSLSSGTASGTVTLTLNPGCAWTVTSDQSWFTVTSAASGTGGATVAYSAAANPNGAARTASFVIAGQTVGVTQAGLGCTATLAPTSLSVGAAASMGSITLTVAGGCAWTAASDSGWLTITSAASGTGGMSVGYAAAANGSSQARSATLTIAGQTVAVTQAGAACTPTFTPASVTLSATAATGTVAMVLPTGCAWTASSDSAWFTLTSAASGSGGASIAYSATANPAGTARSATLTVAGQSVSVTQAGVACTASVAPTSVSLAAAAATGSVVLTLPAGCTWTAASDSDWLTLTSAASGTGGATIGYAATANASGVLRSATLTIKGQSVIVAQAAAPGPPRAVSVVPATGSGTSQVFSFVYTDTAGASDLAGAYASVNDGQKFCLVQADSVHGLVYLLNDGLTAWLGPLSLGSAATLQNSQCTVSGTGSGVSVSGTQVTLALALTFKAAFAGSKNITGFAQSAGGLTSGWISLGTWTVPGVAPQAVSVSPASGSGTSQTFSLLYSDPAGAADLASGYVSVNNGVASCMVQADLAHGSLYLLNDAMTSWTGPITVGTASTLQNSQCTASGTGSAVSVVGNQVTLSVALTFKSAFTGAKNVFAFAQAASGLTSGWVPLGTWTVPGTAPPQVLAVSPSSGSGSSQTFSFIYSNPAGGADLAWGYASINNGQTSCMVQADLAHGALYLLNDAQTVWAGPITAGTSSTLQNSQCTLTGTGSGAGVAGNQVTLTLALAFKTSFAGAKNVYGYGQSASGLNSGWISLGTWTVPGGAPQAVSVAPASGSGTSQTFSFVYSDASGGADLTVAYASINNGVTGCQVQADLVHGWLYLLNDALTGWAGPITAGTATTLQNSQCTLAGAGSGALVSGNQVTLNLALSFKAAFTGPKNVFGYAQTAGGLNTGWAALGTWTVTGGTPPQVVSVTPSSGSGSSRTFSFVYSDPYGGADLTYGYASLNNGVTGCQVQADLVHGVLYLLNDAQTAWLGPVTVGTAATAQNSQCTVSGTGSGVVVSGNQAVLSLNLAFKPVFAGLKNVFGYVQSAGGLNSGWTALGTWTAQ